jgi:lysophospholipase L1-like esterase
MPEARTVARALRTSRGLRRSVLVAVSMLIAGAFALGASAAPAQAQSDTAGGQRAVAPLASRLPTITVSVLGDSNTSASTLSLGQGLALGSWPATGITAKYHAVLHGGWAQSGANSAAARTHAADWKPDVLIVMISTNDILWNHVPVSLTKTRANIVAAVAKVRPKAVIISGIAPLTVAGNPGQSASEVKENANLKSLAQQHGWHFVDPWAQFRAPNGTWANPSDTRDGIHGTVATWSRVGKFLGESVDAVG